jgi:magnesium chelatase subunit H
MMFMDDHARAIRPALEARRMSCDALVAVMSIPEIAKLTRMGKLVMGGPESGMMAMLKKLRGKSSSGAPSAGAKQMAMLRRLPRLLRFIPGTAQDLRVYFLTLQYWLAGSEENLSALISCLVDRYADGPRKVYRGTLKVADPIDYPDVGIYHPRMKGRIGDDPDQIPARAIGAVREKRGRVGVLVLRSIRSLETPPTMTG